MRTNSTGAVSIIGGADGPTSVFIAGRSQMNYTGIMGLKKRISKIKRKDILMYFFLLLGVYCRSTLRSPVRHFLPDTGSWYRCPARSPAQNLPL